MAIIRIYRNPWEHTVPNEALRAILENIAMKRVDHIADQYQNGHYSRSSLALVILDPTAPLWRPSSETLLAAILIGPDAERFLPNAIAKAVEHRDKGILAGYGAYVDMTQTEDGDFTYGYSTQVDDTIGGASGESEIQDACEAGYALVSFNYHIRSFRIAWRKANPDKRWFCNEDLPRTLYTEMAAQTPLIWDSSQDAPAPSLEEALEAIRADA